jgi:glucosylceramidase
VGWVDSTGRFQIPFIQRAKNLSAGNLELFASAWTAPKWMKTNGQYSDFGFLHKNMYQAWAEYYVKFLDSYQKQGIEFWGLTTGNEPSLGIIPFIKISSVGWLPKMMVLQCVPLRVLLNLRLLGDLDSVQFGPHNQRL